MHASRPPLRAPASLPQSALPAHVQPLRRPTPLVKADALAFLRFEVTDLDAS